MKHFRRIILACALVCVFHPPLEAHSPFTNRIVPVSSTVSPGEENADGNADNAGSDMPENFDTEFEEEFGDALDSQVYDPLSGYNRFMTVVNDKIYFWFFKPLARGYRFAVPQGVRIGVNRMYTNLLFPTRLVNNILQLKFKYAGEETARFFVNTTIGVLGFWDPAREKFGWKPHVEDFGQTLGHYGVGSGIHIVLPLWGPTNLRDMAGLYPDFYLDPVSQIPAKYQFATWMYLWTNDYSLEIGEYEGLKKDALDLYPFLRDTYEQKRNREIKE